MGHPHHSKSGECYGKNNDASFNHRERAPWNALHANCSTKSSSEPKNCDFSVFDKTFDTSFKPHICVIFLKHLQITLQYDNTLCT